MSEGARRAFQEYRKGIRLSVTSASVCRLSVGLSESSHICFGKVSKQYRKSIKRVSKEYKKGVPKEYRKRPWTGKIVPKEYSKRPWADKRKPKVSQKRPCAGKRESKKYQKRPCAGKRVSKRHQKRPRTTGEERSRPRKSSARPL